jgi:hypothetical protein
MSLSISTAMIIASRDDLVYSHAGPSENGQFSGWITMPNGRPLLSTQPTFEAAEQAEQHMLDLRDKCMKKFD